LALNGGARQWLDVLFFIPARIFRKNIIIHHHSFAYLTSKSSAALKIIAMLGGNVLHIALCDRMKSLLNERYQLALENIIVISNAAFVQVGRENYNQTSGIDDYCGFGNKSNGPIIGYLSKVSREKGVFDYLDLLAELRKNGIELTGVIAGELDDKDRHEFNDRLKNDRKISYIGPIYGEKKEKFLRTINVLVFPTRYLNEAEPVAILEALSRGVPVISYMRGCISSLVSTKAGYVFDVSITTIKEIATTLKTDNFFTNLEAYAVEARRTFEELKESSKSSLNFAIRFLSDEN